MKKLLLILTTLLFTTGVNAKPITIDGFNLGMSHGEIMSQIEKWNYVEHRTGMYKHASISGDPYMSGNRWIEFDTSINNVYGEPYIQLGCGFTETCHMNLKQIKSKFSSLTYPVWVGKKPNIEQCAMNISGDQICISKGLDGKFSIGLYAQNFVPETTSSYITYQGFTFDMTRDELVSAASDLGLAIINETENGYMFAKPTWAKGGEGHTRKNGQLNINDDFEGQWVMYNTTQNMILFGCSYLGCDSRLPNGKNDDIDTPKKTLGSSLGQNLQFTPWSYVGTCATAMMGEYVCVESGYMDGKMYSMGERVVILSKYQALYQ